MLSTLFLILHWSLALFLTLRLMIKRKPVGESLAWLFVIYAMPIIGAFLYYAFGERRQSEKRLAHFRSRVGGLHAWQNRLQGAHETVLQGKDELERNLIRFVRGASGFPAVQIEDWKLLPDFDSSFEELLRLMEGAQKTIHLEFYIWEVAGQVTRVQEALLHASSRGVTCRVLVDALGSDPFINSRERHELEAAGVHVVVSLRMRLFGARWDLRNHRKIAVIDGQYALAGSMNLVDPVLFKSDAKVGRWVDAMVRLGGQGAACLDSVFLQDWSVETSTPFEELSDPKSTQHTPVEADKSPMLAQVFPSGPERYPDAIHQVFMTCIYSATEELIISTPYFAPDDAIHEALIAAAVRGVRVRLVVPRTSDVRIATLAGAAQFSTLLEAGVEIAHFQGGLLHTKSITVDRRVSIFGTVNLDMRSLWLNSEVTLLAYDRPFTAELRAMQMAYWKDSVPLDLKSWKKRPRHRKILEGICRMFGPLL
ncbi:MAG: cardiolipin synthase [Planctomycetes bacterium]|nr:cardiolipin synthase [Planctomycetota bacterium]